ncbi:MAG TPA: CerR family C-terminal domain-containing protein [Rubrivivax sp.]|nr:CerR family C-terminal domain-containing protein [Rubrivivax sp.]
MTHPVRTRGTPRPDGEATRAHLLDTAGRVFAERGFAGTTSKEICARAGTPLASVNYHFGSRDALYEAVLIEAHRQLIGLDDLQALTQGLDGAEARLRAVLAHLVALATQRSTPWGFRVMLREFLAPSPAIPALIDKALRPKARWLLGLMAEFLNLPAEHAAVQRGVMLSVLPCMALMIAPKELPARLLPGAAKDGEALGADFVCFAMAGLQALALAHRPARTKAAANARSKPSRRAPAGA